MNTDTQLHKDVLDALTFDRSIDASNVAIAVKEGVVRLSGPVPSHAEKMRIEAIVKRVAGVLAIAEELRVNPPDHHRRTDTEIAEAALNILRWDIMVPADKILVQVEQGWVTVSGEVPWHFQREAAERALQNLTYIKGLSNKITLLPESKHKDLKGHVERALKRHSSRALHQILVTVSDDETVTLSGEVPRWQDHDEASWVAWNVPGVREVINIAKVVTPVIV
jgi:osmotically-inducible protein OsmY